METNENKKIPVTKDNVCPICGKKISTNEMVILNNGNPGCTDCAAKEK